MTAKSPTLIEKSMNLFGSLRFWTLTLGAVSAAAAHPEKLFDIISIWLGAVTAIGTADSIAEKASSKKPTP